jgi:hypothetical protein
MKPAVRTVLLCLASALISSVATCGTFAIEATVHDAKTRSHNPRVAFTELLDDMDGGFVSEIRIQGNVYSYIVTRSPSVRALEAVGPKADADSVTALRPTNPALAAPKIVFGSSY